MPPVLAVWAAVRFHRMIPSGFHVLADPLGICTGFIRVLPTRAAGAQVGNDGLTVAFDDMGRRVVPVELFPVFASVAHSDHPFLGGGQATLPAPRFEART